MNSLRSYAFVYLVVVIVLKECVTLGPKDPIDLSFNLQQNDEDSIGRNNALDKLLKENIKAISEENADLNNIIKKAESLVNEAEEKRSAQYYVDLLKLIAEEGSMSVLHDERERVLIIMESVGQGAEFDHSIKQRNIIGAFAEAEANFIFGRLPDIGARDFSSFEVPDLTSTKSKNFAEIQPEEPTGEKADDFRRSTTSAKSKESQPEIPVGDQDRTVAKDEIKVTEKQPEIPDGDSETVDLASSKPDGSVDEKLPETPDGESRSEPHETNELMRNINGSKLPKIPTGKKHDEM